MTLRHFLANLTFFSDSIFMGFRYIVPVLFFLMLLGPKKWAREIKLFIYSAAVLLITAGAMFLTVVGTNLFMAWYYGNEAERDFIVRIATGSTWYQLFIPFINFGILPILLWFRQLRKSIHTPFIIVVLWMTFDYWVKYLTEQRLGTGRLRDAIVWDEITIKCSVFVGLLLMVWGWMKFKENRRRTREILSEPQDPDII